MFTPRELYVLKAFGVGDDSYIDEQGRYLIFRQIGGKTVPMYSTVEDFADDLYRRGINFDPSDQTSLRQLEDRMAYFAQIGEEYGLDFAGEMQEEFFDQLEEAQREGARMAYDAYQSANTEHRAIMHKYRDLVDKLESEKKEQTIDEYRAERAAHFDDILAGHNKPVGHVSDTYDLGWEGIIGTFTQLGDKSLRGTPKGELLEAVDMLGLRMLEMAQQGHDISKVTLDSLMKDELEDRHILKTRFADRYAKHHESSAAGYVAIRNGFEHLKHNLKENGETAEAMREAFSTMAVAMQRDFSARADRAREFERGESIDVSELHRGEWDTILTKELPEKYSAREGARLSKYIDEEGHEVSTKDRRLQVARHLLARVITQAGFTVSDLSNAMNGEQGSASFPQAYADGYTYFMTDRDKNDTKTKGALLAESTHAVEEYLAKERPTAKDTARVLRTITRNQAYIDAMDADRLTPLNSKNWKAKSTETYGRSRIDEVVNAIRNDPDKISSHLLKNSTLKLQYGKAGEQAPEAPEPEPEPEPGETFSRNPEKKRQESPSGFYLEPMKPADALEAFGGDESMIDGYREDAGSVLVLRSPEGDALSGQQYNPTNKPVEGLPDIKEAMGNLTRDLNAANKVEAPEPTLGGGGSEEATVAGSGFRGIIDRDSLSEEDQGHYDAIDDLLKRTVGLTVEDFTNGEATITPSTGSHTAALAIGVDKDNGELYAVDLFVGDNGVEEGTTYTGDEIVGALNTYTNSTGATVYDSPPEVDLPDEDEDAPKDFTTLRREAIQNSRRRDSQQPAPQQTTQQAPQEATQAEQPSEEPAAEEPAIQDVSQAANNRTDGGFNVTDLHLPEDTLNELNTARERAESTRDKYKEYRNKPSSGAKEHAGKQAKAAAMEFHALKNRISEPVISKYKELVSEWRGESQEGLSDEDRQTALREILEEAKQSVYPVEGQEPFRRVRPGENDPPAPEPLYTSDGQRVYRDGESIPTKTPTQRVGREFRGASPEQTQQEPQQEEAPVASEQVEETQPTTEEHPATEEQPAAEEQVEEAQPNEDATVEPSEPDDVFNEEDDDDIFTLDDRVTIPEDVDNDVPTADDISTDEIDIPEFQRSNEAVGDIDELLDRPDTSLPPGTVEAMPNPRAATPIERTSSGERVVPSSAQEPTVTLPESNEGEPVEQGAYSEPARKPEVPAYQRFLDVGNEPYRQQDEIPQGAYSGESEPPQFNQVIQGEPVPEGAYSGDRVIPEAPERNVGDFVPRGAYSGGEYRDPPIPRKTFRDRLREAFGGSRTPATPEQIDQSPKNIDRLLKHRTPDGGTYPLFEGDETPTTGYTASRKGEERRIPKEALSPDEISSYLDKIKDKVEPGEFFGVWLDKDTDEYVFDISRHFDNEAEALAYARRNGQKAYFDVAGNSAKPIKELPEGRGGVQESMFDFVPPEDDTPELAEQPEAPVKPEDNQQSLFGGEPTKTSSKTRRAAPKKPKEQPKPSAEKAEEKAQTKEPAKASEKTKAEEPAKEAPQPKAKEPEKPKESAPKQSEKAKEPAKEAAPKQAEKEPEKKQAEKPEPKAPEQAPAKEEKQAKAPKPVEEAPAPAAEPAPEAEPVKEEAIQEAPKETETKPATEASAPAEAPKAASAAEKPRRSRKPTAKPQEAEQEEKAAAPEEAPKPARKPRAAKQTAAPAPEPAPEPTPEPTQAEPKKEEESVSSVKPSTPTGRIVRESGLSKETNESLGGLYSAMQKGGYVLEESTSKDGKRTHYRVLNPEGEMVGAFQEGANGLSFFSNKKPASLEELTAAISGEAPSEPAPKAAEKPAEKPKAEAKPKTKPKPKAKTKEAPKEEATTSEEPPEDWDDDAAKDDDDPDDNPLMGGEESSERARKSNDTRAIKKDDGLEETDSDKFGEGGLTSAVKPVSAKERAAQKRAAEKEKKEREAQREAEREAANREIEEREKAETEKIRRQIKEAGLYTPPGQKDTPSGRKSEAALAEEYPRSETPEGETETESPEVSEQLRSSLSKESAAALDKLIADTSSAKKKPYDRVTTGEDGTLRFYNKNFRVVVRDNGSGELEASQERRIGDSYHDTMEVMWGDEITPKSLKKYLSTAIKSVNYVDFL